MKVLLDSWQLAASIINSISGIEKQWLQQQQQQQQLG